MFSKLGSHLLVNDVKSESVSSPLHLGDQVADGLDALHLLAQVLGLEEVAQVTVALVPGHLVDVEQALVDRLLKLERGLHGFQRAAPVHRGRLGDVLEDNLPSSPVLILDELLGMISLLVGVLLEEGGEAGVSDVISVEVVSLVEYST